MGHAIHTESLILDVLVEILSFLVAILVLVTIHEWGHYWVARRCGVAIEKFSIGFGKTIFSWKNREGTEFCLAMIPLGGYVKMRGEYAIATSEAQTQAEKGSFAACSVWQRMAIVAAGPVVNLLFAALVFAGLQYGSAQMPAAVLAAPPANSALASVGIKDGDTLLAVNQTPIQNYPQAQRTVIKSLLGQESIQLQWRDAQGQTHTSAALNLNNISLDQVDWQERLGMVLYQKTARIEQVIPNSVAEKAGIKTNDELIGINGASASGNHILDVIHASPNKPVLLSVSRQNEHFSLEVVPQAETLPIVQAGQEPIVIGRIGVQVAGNYQMVSEERGFLRAAYLGVDTTIEQVGLNLKGLYKVLTGHLSVKNIGGPVTIAKQAGNSAHAGFTQFLGFLAVLSVSLGTLNLLPIPVLDGGHLVYYAAELLRGKPLPEKILIIGQKIGLILLLMFMGIALLNDMRWFT